MPDKRLTIDNEVPCLYYMLGTRSTRPRWLLEELDIPYELKRVDMQAGEHKTASFLAINPLAKLPVLTQENVTITESLAICLYLADRYPEADLAPALNKVKRAQYYKWMVFSIGTFEPAIIEETRRQCQNDESARSTALTNISIVTQVLETALTGQNYLLGDKFSVADIMVGSVANWANNAKLLMNKPHTLTWLDNLKARPAYQRSI